MMNLGETNSWTKANIIFGGVVAICAVLTFVWLVFDDTPRQPIEENNSAFNNGVVYGDNVGKKVSYVDTVAYFKEIGLTASSSLNKTTYTLTLETVGKNLPSRLCVLFKPDGSVAPGGAIYLSPGYGATNFYQTTGTSGPQAICTSNPQLGKWVAKIIVTGKNRTFDYDFYPKSKNQDMPKWVSSFLGFDTQNPSK